MFFFRRSVQIVINVTFLILPKLCCTIWAGPDPVRCRRHFKLPRRSLHASYWSRFYSIFFPFLLFCNTIFKVALKIFLIFNIKPMFFLLLKIQLGEIYISKLKQVLIKQGGDFQTFNCKITKDFRRWLNYLSWRFDIWQSEFDHFMGILIKHFIPRFA